MAKRRVHELATEYGQESKVILKALKEMGEFVKSASSTVEPAVERRLRAKLGDFSGWSKPRAEEKSEPVAECPDPLKGDRGTTFTSSVSGLVPPAVEVGEVPTRVVSLHSLADDNELRVVLRECKRANERGSKVIFDLEDAQGFYPAIATPVVATIQHFREHSVPVEMRNLPPVADVMRIRNPLEASKQNLAEVNEPLSRLWVYFDHTQANGLTTAFMDCIRRKVECREGVLEALEWCLYEVLDNVMQHSKSGTGYAMLQLHVKSKRLVVCVSDTGIGVQRSLASSDAYRPRTAFDALTMAVREGVTRNDKTNQGNGLFGLTKIVEQNGGKLHLRSGRGHMLLQGNRVSGANDQDFIGPDNHGMTVDFQLKVDKPVSLGDALNYEPTNLFMEGLESAEGEHIISIRHQAGGAGSRIAARETEAFDRECAE